MTAMVVYRADSGGSGNPGSIETVVGEQLGLHQARRLKNRTG